uniref:Dynein light chain n=1 Tax=Glossina brevipalpis TaxID=37001 RepID=A0A1A9W2D0_9MUSC
MHKGSVKHEARESTSLRKKQQDAAKYKMRPTLDEAFKTQNIRQIIREVVHDKLQGKAYNVDDIGQWIRDIADTVNTTVQERLLMPRYKYVVQVMIGQQTGAGCHYFAKCYWDVDTDSHISFTYTNPTLFCVCTVFGIYLY